VRLGGGRADLPVTGVVGGISTPDIARLPETLESFLWRCCSNGENKGGSLRRLFRGTSSSSCSSLELIKTGWPDLFLGWEAELSDQMQGLFRPTQLAHLPCCMGVPSVCEAMMHSVKYEWPSRQAWHLLGAVDRPAQRHMSSEASMKWTRE
jgi:hypothetical protein